MTDRPTTLTELLMHYREMARLHHERWRDETQSEDRRSAGLAMSTAYQGAADELEHVMSLGEHLVVFAEDRWTMEHPLRCRESGHMEDCVVHRRVADLIVELGEAPRPLGRYIVKAGERLGFEEVMSPQT